MSFVAITTAYPSLKPWLDRIDLPVMPPAGAPILPDAVVKIVVGQMLSTTAANTIYARLCDLAADGESGETWNLSHDEMRSVGLSGRKIRTIHEFAQVLRDDPERIESWVSLSYDDLKRDVCSFWGLSQWSADMLAIFHLGHTDVFPTGDGTIKRSMQELHSAGAIEDTFDGSDASPHRTLLALAFWKFIDDGVFQNVK